jgi:hypothetical protein
MLADFGQFGDLDVCDQLRMGGKHDTSYSNACVAVLSDDVTPPGLLRHGARKRDEEGL